MPKFNELEIASLDGDQLQKLEETEKFINASRSHDIYLLALRKRDLPGTQ